MKTIAEKTGVIGIAGYHALSIHDGCLRYRKVDYPLAGAHARVESMGWRSQKHELIIEGPEVSLAVRVPNKNQRIAYTMAQQINNAAGQAV